LKPQRSGAKETVWTTAFVDKREKYYYIDESKYSVNPLYPALKRLPFSGFQSSLIADRRGSAIRPAIETLQKANRSCGRARMATSTVDHGFTGYLLLKVLHAAQALAPREIDLEKET